MKKTMFIVQLPEKTQKEIEKELREMNLDEEDIESAMNSRLADLSDTIDINKYLIL